MHTLSLLVLQVSVLLLTQNLYTQGKRARTIGLNSQNYILFKNPRDVTTINILARQTGFGQKLIKAYRDAMSRGKYPYLWIDLHMKTPDNLRMRTKVLPNELCTIYT